MCAGSRDDEAKCGKRHECPGPVAALYSRAVGDWRKRAVCRNIRPLFNVDLPATEDEIRAASLQFVRKISGVNRPSRVNEAAFDAAVVDIAQVAGRLLIMLESRAAPANRAQQAAIARARAARRFGE